MDIDFKKLAAPFPADEILWRLSHSIERDGRIMGLALAYYDARCLYERLDDVCGPANWQIRYPHANGKTCAEIGIKIGDDWVWKANGAGDTQVEAEKGAFSDAAKRAGVPWGIGRYLYEFKNTWVECEKRGKTTVIRKDQYTKLNNAYALFLKNGKFPEIETKPAGIEQSEFLLIEEAFKEANSPEEITEALNTKLNPALPRMSEEQKQALRNVYGARLTAVSQAPLTNGANHASR